MKQKIDTSWLDNIHSSLETLQGVSSRLYDLATAFYHTGNQSMGRVLTNDSTIIDSAIRQIHTALGTILSNDVNKGQRQIAEIFKSLAESLEKKDGKLETSGKT